MVTHGIIYVVADLGLAVICRKQVRVNFVDKNFVNHVRLHFVSYLDYFPKVFACSLVVLLLCVDHVDYSAAVFYLRKSMRILIIPKNGVAWEIYDIERNVFIVFHKSCFNLSGRLQVVGLMH